MGGGKRYTTTGSSLDVSGRYYCCDYSNTTEWVTDLDEIYSKGDTSGTCCNDAVSPNGTNEGFDFTTTLCCGDDANETYSDSAENGDACYNGKILQTCSQTSENKTAVPDDIINEDGILLGCNYDASGITKADYCSIVCGNKFCSYESKWKDTEEKNRSVASTWVDSSVNLPTECCEQGKCWNGSVCVDNAVNDSVGDVYSGYRCVDGSWKEAKLVYTPDGATSGYCPNKDQCLVGLQSDPMCIDDGEYVNGTDDYCENGNWTSRTKYVALQLSTLPTSDYTLFCGDYEETLNFLDYIVKDSKIARNYVKDNTNNYCVLNYNGEIVFGTSLNQEIDASDYSFVDITKISNCDNAKSYNDGYYYQCSVDNVWHNKKLNSVIYSENTISLPQTDLSSELSWLEGVFSDLIGKLEEKISSPYDQSFKDVKKYRSLYLTDKGDKSIAGVFEEVNYDNIMVKYINFNTDICSITNAYHSSHSDSFSGILCSNEEKNYYVLAQGGLFTTLNPPDIWPGLTGTLRVG